MMGLPDGPKSFRIGLVVLIQYRLDRHPASHVAVAITLNALAKAKALSLKTRDVVTGLNKEFDDIFNHVATIHQHDTDGWTDRCWTTAKATLMHESRG